MDKTAFQLNERQKELKERAKAFGEKWAPFAKDMDVLNKAPFKKMLKDSAVTEIETSAVLDGNEYVVNGTKRFITGAPDCDIR